MTKYLLFLLTLCFGCSKSQEIAIKKIQKSAVAQEGQFQLSPPIIEYENIFFEGENVVQIKFNHKDTKIFYTLDGSEPTAKSNHYNQSVVLKNTSKISAKAFHENCQPSEIVAQQFLKISKKNPIKNVQLLTALTSDYVAKGASSLSDRKKGSANFRDGNWLGFQNDTIEILLEMKSDFDFGKIIISHFEDANSWIFIPQKIEVFTSKNGKEFQKTGEVSPTPTTSKTPSRFNFLEVKTKENKNSKFVKILLQNISGIPEWHPGKGNPAWIFIDEILFQ